LSRRLLNHLVSTWCDGKPIAIDRPGGDADGARFRKSQSTDIPEIMGRCYLVRIGGFEQRD